MMETYETLADRLLAIEMELRALGLWDSEAPAAAALASTEPFCVDTLRFSQWLQFILLPRLQALLEAGAQLPANSEIAPMAELALQGMEGDPTGLVAELQALDRLLSRP